MANLIKIDTGEYPVSVQEFKARHPNTSFPVQIPFGSFGYAVVFDYPRPSHTRLQKLVELAPEYIGGHYEQRWEVVDLTGEELAAALAQIALEKRIVTTARLVSNMVEVKNMRYAQLLKRGDLINALKLKG